MDFDLTTFVLEAVNFLVLLWLLTRLLYHPLRAALDARAQAEARRRAELDAERAALDARAAQLQTQARELDARRDTAQRDLAADIAQRRQAQLAELDTELAAERAKARARFAQEDARARLDDERTQRRRASEFLAGYLRRLATPAVEQALIELFLADLGQQSEAARAALRAGPARGDEARLFDVTTAFSTPREVCARVESQVDAVLGETARYQWRIDPRLDAGICVHLPGHSLEASLRRGVDAFAGDG